MELCCRTKLRYHALAAGCYNSFFGEGEERNHRDCRRRGSAQRFTGEGLCNPMLNSASDLWGELCKTSMFFLSLLLQRTSETDDSAWLFSYLTLKAQCTRLLGGVSSSSSSRQLTPSKDADVWRGDAYERKARREGVSGRGGGAGVR